MLPDNHAYTLYVKRVAARIIKAAGMESMAFCQYEVVVLYLMDNI